MLLQVEWLKVDGNQTIKNKGKISGAVPVQDGMWVARLDVGGDETKEYEYYMWGVGEKPEHEYEIIMTPGFCKNGECHSPYGGKDTVKRTYEQLLIKVEYVLV